MTDETEDFERFLRRRKAAATAFVNGDSGPLGDLVARDGTTTSFEPHGGHRIGDDVALAYERDAALFAAGGETRFETVHLAASGGIGYWVGFQRIAARVRGQAEPSAVDLRVTEIFRRDGDAWKLVHRHADFHARSPDAPRISQPLAGVRVPHAR